MGRQIVYCQGCGARLTEQDFDKGRAHHLGHHPYCTSCKPLPGPGSSARTPAARKGSGSRQPMPTPRTPSRAVQVPEPRRARPVGLIAAGAGTLVGIAVVVALLSRPAAPPSPPPPPPKVDRAAQALADLERFLATKPQPEAVLARVDAARPLLGTGPNAERLKAIEAAARAELDKLRPIPVDRLTPFLKDIRTLIAKDGSLARKNDVLAMLDSAARIAGDRLPEVEMLRAEYQERLKKGESPKDIVLEPAAARRSGRTLHVDRSEGDLILAGFNSRDCIAEWDAEIPRAGLWSVVAEQANGGNEGDYKIVCGPEELLARSKGTGSWDRFVTRDLGRIRLPAGQLTLRLVPTSLRGGLMNLKSLKLSWAGD